MSVDGAEFFKRCTVVCFNEEKIEVLRGSLPGEGELREAANRHKALGHPTRQAILHILGVEACCVCDLAAVLNKPVSTVSQHLRLLWMAGCLEMRQQGKLVFYSPAREEGGSDERAASTVESSVLV